jgi:hypothetical protein
MALGSSHRATAWANDWEMPGTSRSEAMTTIVGAANGGTNVYSSDQLLDLATGSLSSFNTTQFTLSNADFVLTAYGTGLTGGHSSARKSVREN